MDTENRQEDTPFIIPSIDEIQIFAGRSYAYFSTVPEILTTDPSTECVLGIDEAGRGPVLGELHLSYSSLHLTLYQTHRGREIMCMVEKEREIEIDDMHGR